MRKVISTVFVLFLSAVGIFGAGGSDSDAAAEPDNTVEVLHWWTSEGEAAALNLLKQDLESKGIEWTDSPVAGGGGEQAMTVLRSRATAGNPPAAVQMLGFDILDWAELGFLADLNQMAQAENWDAVIPNAVKQFSKYQGSWIAAPVNVHSTNWVWGNKAVMDELGIDVPETWEEYIAALDAVQASGRTALAHGGQPWQTATIFDGVVMSAGGPEFYRSAMIDLNRQALESPQMLEVFRRMGQLRGYVDDNFSGRDWNLATAMVIEGDAGFQMMGDWAKGEFFNAGREAGVDFVGFRTPGSKGTVTFNSDQFVMFAVDQSKQAAQAELAKAVLDPGFQVAFNTVKGSVPARTDVSDAEFTVIGKEAIQDLIEADAAGTLMGSMAHGHASPAAVKNAIYDVVSAHFNGLISSEEAVEQLAAAIEAARQQ